MLVEALRDAVAPHVGTGSGAAVPGAVVGVLVGGTRHVTALGHGGPDGSTHLAPRTRVRASSNTKPMTAALTHVLAADGVLALDDPVERFVPELADRRVLPDPYAAPDTATPAERSITVEDLLTMRMGFGFPVDPTGEGESAALAAAAAAGLGIGPPVPDAELGVDTWLARFAELPLMRPPGTAWMYDLSFAVLGAVLTRAAGRPLDTLYQDRLFGPLGMADTGFVAPAGALVPQWVSEAGTLAQFDPGAGSAWERRPGFPDARGGLVTTAADLLRFAELLLGDGTTRDGVALLDPEAVAAMTGDRLTADQRRGPEASAFLGGRGWGHGMEVVTPEHGPVAGGRSVHSRRYGWAGGLGTLWYSYPEHDTAAVLLTQVMPPAGPLFAAFGAALAETVDAA